jgi:hypothetical protein
MVLERLNQESLGSILIEAKEPFTGSLWWTDTRYPGWSATVDGESVPLVAAAPLGSRIDLQRATRIHLRYEPTYLWPALGGTALGGVVLLLAFGFGHAVRRRFAFEGA